MNATAQKRSAPSTRAIRDPDDHDEAPARDPIEVLWGRVKARSNPAEYLRRRS
jgi:hypothetical protein